MRSCLSCKHPMLWIRVEQPMYKVLLNFGASLLCTLAFTSLGGWRYPLIDPDNDYEAYNRDAHLSWGGVPFRRLRISDRRGLVGVAILGFLRLVHRLIGTLTFFGFVL